LYIHVNKIPIDGNCTVFPLSGIAILDHFQMTCDGWIDPEDIGIKHYIINSETNVLNVSSGVHARHTFLIVFQVKVVVKRHL
jgi:hypothetical protein